MELLKTFFFDFEQTCENHFSNADEKKTFVDDWKDEITKCFGEKKYLKQFISNAEFMINVNSF